MSEQKVNKVKPRVKIIGPITANAMEEALDKWIGELWESDDWNGGPKVQMLVVGEYLTAWITWQETMSVYVMDAESQTLLREETKGGIELPSNELKLIT